MHVSSPIVHKVLACSRQSLDLHHLFENAQDMLTWMHAAVQAFIRHPDKPSQARCDELAEPWHDPYAPEAPDR